ncbi:MAG: hypothetical protein AAGA77_17135 [Bacteroidota bacterium]
MIDINNITILVGLATLIWSIWKYYDSKKRDQNLKEFENYHRLIKELVQPENGEEGAMYVDRQTSVMYELRHFKRYYPISLRTMKGLYEKWSKVPDQFPRLLEEAELTIMYLEKKNKS